MDDVGTGENLVFKRLEYYISKLTVARLGKGSAYPEIQPVVFTLITAESKK